MSQENNMSGSNIYPNNGMNDVISDVVEAADSENEKANNILSDAKTREEISQGNDMIIAAKAAADATQKLEEGNPEAAVQSISKTFKNFSEYSKTPLPDDKVDIKNIELRFPKFLNGYYDDYDIIIAAAENSYPCYIRTIQRSYSLYMTTKIIMMTMLQASISAICYGPKGIAYGAIKLRENVSNGISATKNMASRGLTNTREAASRGYSAVKNSISNRFSPKVNESQLTSIVPQPQSQLQPQPQPTKKWGIFGGYKKHRKNKLKTRKHKKYKSKRTRI